MYTRKSAAGAHEIDRRKTFVDTRSSFEYLLDQVKSYEAVIFYVILLSFFTFAFPLLIFITLPITLGFCFVNTLSRTNKILPLKLPIDKLRGKVDYHDNKPGSRTRFGKAAGTVNIGNEIDTKKELWVTGKDLLTHIMYIATTGGGKTDTLVSMVGSVSFSMGGGCIYVDAKAATKLLFQFAAMARMTGREEHLRIISFNTGSGGAKKGHWKKLSNTTQPFSHGASSVCVQVIEGVMPDAGGESGYFKDRALVTLNTLFPALVELRDAKLINISPSLIAEFASISLMCQIGYPEFYNSEIKYKRWGEYEDTILPNIVSRSAREGIKLFLKNLPEFKEDENSIRNPSEQPEQVEKQFGFGKGYFLKALASLSATYGHIYECEVGEADFADCVLNNRILLVMIPAMQESTEQRQMLGKLSLSSIRVAMSLGLGDETEGDVDDILNSLPIDLRIPSLMIVDEYAECAVPGFAVTATQGRGLGMACCFSGQDLAGFIRADENEANMIFGNTRLKMLGTLQDADVTLKKFKELAGTVRTAEASGWEKGEGFDKFQNDLKSQIKESERLNIRDLANQVEGEVHLFYKADMILTDMFHFGVNEEKAKNFRHNRLLPIPFPPPEDIEKLKRISRNNIMLEEEIDEGALPSLESKTLFGNNLPMEGTQWIYDLLTEDVDINHEEKSKLIDNDKPTHTSKECKPIVDNQAQLFDKVAEFNKVKGSFYDKDFIKKTNLDDYNRLINNNKNLKELKNTIISLADSKKEGYNQIKQLEQSVKDEVKNITQENAGEHVKQGDEKHVNKRPANNNGKTFSISLGLGELYSKWVENRNNSQISNCNSDSIPPKNIDLNASLSPHDAIKCDSISKAQSFSEAADKLIEDFNVLFEDTELGNTLKEQVFSKGLPLDHDVVQNILNEFPNDIEIWNDTKQSMDDITEICADLTQIIDKNDIAEEMKKLLEKSAINLEGHVDSIMENSAEELQRALSELLNKLPNMLHNNASMSM